MKLSQLGVQLEQQRMRFGEGVALELLTPHVCCPLLRTSSHKAIH